MRLLRGDCIVEIGNLVQDEVAFNGTTLKIVTDIRSYTSHADDSYINELYDALAKEKRDTEAKRKVQKELMGVLGQVNKEVGDSTDHGAAQATRHGRLVRKPERSPVVDGWDFSCELDAEEGDEVWWDSFYSSEQRSRGVADSDKVIEQDGKKYLIIPSRSLFCAKRGGEMIPLNGFVIGKEIPNEKKAGAIYLPDTGVSRVEVMAAPKSLPVYVKPELWKNTKVEVGNKILVRSHFAIKLDSTLGSTTDYVRVANRTILAIE